MANSVGADESARSASVRLSAKRVICRLGLKNVRSWLGSWNFCRMAVTAGLLSGVESIELLDCVADVGLLLDGLLLSLTNASRLLSFWGCGIVGFTFFLQVEP